MINESCLGREESLGRVEESSPQLPSGLNVSLLLQGPLRVKHQDGTQKGRASFPAHTLAVGRTVGS